MLLKSTSTRIDAGVVSDYGLYDDGRETWNPSIVAHLTQDEVNDLCSTASNLYSLAGKAAVKIFSSEPELAGLPDSLLECAISDLSSEQDDLVSTVEFLYDGTSFWLDGIVCDPVKYLTECGPVSKLWAFDQNPVANQYNDIVKSISKDLKDRFSEKLVLLGIQALKWPNVITGAVLQDIAEGAGVQSRVLVTGELRWNNAKSCFRTPENEDIETVHLLMPWRWAAAVDQGELLAQAYQHTQWTTSVGAALRSHGRILHQLWEENGPKGKLLPR